MMSLTSQQAIQLIVALLVGKYLPTEYGIFFLIGGIVLFWALHEQNSIASFIKGLYSPAPRQAIHKPAPLVYLYDPETQRLEGISRELAMHLLEARRRIG